MRINTENMWDVIRKHNNNGYKTVKKKQGGITFILPYVLLQHSLSTANHIYLQVHIN